MEVVEGIDVDGRVCDGLVEAVEDVGTDAEVWMLVLVLLNWLLVPAVPAHDVR